MGNPPADAQMTFVVDSRLYGVAVDGTLICLADLKGRSPSSLLWSPDGDEVLAGPDKLIHADNYSTSTGYRPQATNVRWSAPKGTALIAPNSAGRLIWQNAYKTDIEIDVSAANNVTSAAYHPSGKQIASAGDGLDGKGPGVFVSSNRGANAIRVGLLSEESAATEMSFNMIGNELDFIHRHADGQSHLHRYLVDRGGGVLSDLPTTPYSTLSNLTVSTVDDSSIAWTETDASNESTTHVSIESGVSQEIRLPIAQRMSTPIGWLPNEHLLVAVRPIGADAVAPFELWNWSSGGMQLVIDHVSAAAARTAIGAFAPAGGYQPLTILPGSEFG